MIGTVSHVNSVSEHRKFQADGFFRQNVQFLLLKSPFISILVLEFFLMMIMMMMVMMIHVIQTSRKLCNNKSSYIFKNILI